MFDPKAIKRPKAKVLVSAQNTSRPTLVISEPVTSQDQIRERAYQIYQSRGRQDGQAQQDWLAAEQQLLNGHK
ncbi:MAG: DUF2934 domain-containing protein [Candidatus Sulfotelmatobacter sp.]